jgi:hypothetical protein
MDLSYIIILAIGVFFASTILSAIVAKMEHDVLRNKVDLLKRLDEIIHQVKVEKIGDMEYWFDFHSDQFLAQGKTVNEIVEVLKSRFPEHVFLCEEHGGLSAKTEWQFLPMTDFRRNMERIVRE